MRALLQRVSGASVAVGGETIANIEQGLVVFLGVFPEDTPEKSEWLVDKLLGLRIFADDDKPMNRSVVEVGGGVLLVSQFTLAADVTHGRRPGFSTAAAPAQAETLYVDFLARLRAHHAPVAAGRFGADMQVTLVNDGPVTFLLER